MIAEAACSRSSLSEKAGAAGLFRQDTFPLRLERGRGNVQGNLAAQGFRTRRACRRVRIAVGGLPPSKPPKGVFGGSGLLPLPQGRSRASGKGKNPPLPQESAESPAGPTGRKPDICAAPGIRRRAVRTHRRARLQSAACRKKTAALSLPIGSVCAAWPQAMWRPCPPRRPAARLRPAQPGCLRRSRAGFQRFPRCLSR